MGNFGHVVICELVCDLQLKSTSEGGTPRHIVYVSEQLDDYRTVIKYCRQQPEFDPHKVVLWGTSFAGPFPRPRKLIPARTLM